MQEATWDPLKDFTYIIHLTGYVFATFASDTSGFKTWADVVEFAKKNPGKVTYGDAGRRQLACTSAWSRWRRRKASSSRMCRSRARPK